jgi:hypothetical protein
VETLCCPTCLSVLRDGSATRCPSCRARLKGRKGLVLREDARITSRPVLAIERARQAQVVAEIAAVEQRRYTPEPTARLETQHAPQAFVPEAPRRPLEPVVACAPAASLFDLLADYTIDGAPQRTLPITPPAPFEGSVQEPEGAGRTRSRLVRRRPLASRRSADDPFASVRVEVKAEALARMLETDAEEPAEESAPGDAVEAADEPIATAADGVVVETETTADQTDGLASRVGASVDALLALLPVVVDEPAEGAIQGAPPVDEIVELDTAVASDDEPALEVEEPIARVDAAVQALMALLPGAVEVEAPELIEVEAPAPIEVAAPAPIEVADAEVDAPAARVDASVDALMALITPPEAPADDSDTAEEPAAFVDPVAGTEVGPVSEPPAVPRRRRSARRRADLAAAIEAAARALSESETATVEAESVTVEPESVAAVAEPEPVEAIAEREPVAEVAAAEPDLAAPTLALVHDADAEPEPVRPRRKRRAATRRERPGGEAVVPVSLFESPEPAASIVEPEAEVPAPAVRDVVVPEVVPEVVVPEIVSEPVLELANAHANGDGNGVEVVTDERPPSTPVEVLDAPAPPAPPTVDLPAQTRAVRVKTVKVNGKRRWVVDVLVRQEKHKPQRR